MENIVGSEDLEALGSEANSFSLSQFERTVDEYIQNEGREEQLVRNDVVLGQIAHGGSNAYWNPIQQLDAVGDDTVEIQYLEYKSDGQMSYTPTPGTSDEDVPHAVIAGREQGTPFQQTLASAQQVQVELASQVREVPTVPHQRPGPPDQTPFPGLLNFSVEITAECSAKLQISKQLNKFYVLLLKDIPFKFRWSHVGTQMYVRACVVFTKPDDAAGRVNCCRQHVMTDLPDYIAQNVLHSSSPNGTRGVQYQGLASDVDSWYSVLVAFPPGAPRTHSYHFICKNSCPTGISRRDIAIVFSLEDPQGGVHGRQVINACACSCPTRDRRNAETDKRKRVALEPCPPAAPGPSAAKRIKSEPAPGDGCLLPQVDMGDPLIAISALELAARMLQQREQLSEGAARAAAAQRRAAIRDLVQRLQQDYGLSC